MLNSINFKKITATSFLAVLMAEAMLVQTAQSSPVGINELYTTNESATQSTIDVLADGNVNPMNFGTGNNLRLTGFKVDDKDYSLLQLVDRASFNRVNNTQVQGEKHILFLQTDSNDNGIASSLISQMEDAVRSEFINIGTDNVFANQDNVNYNNIERVDFSIDNGLVVQEDYVDHAGFLLLERGGNDPFKIAAITAVDENGQPTEFGNLLTIPQSTWGNSGISLPTSVFQNEPRWVEPQLTASLSGQQINGIFVSIASLGIASGQTIYGYALFPHDIDAGNDLVGLSDFPLTTSSASGEGGLDLISSGGIFIPEGTSPTEVFDMPLAFAD